MKKNICRILNGKCRKLGSIAALAIVGTIVLGCNGLGSNAGNVSTPDTSNNNENRLSASNSLTPRESIPDSSKEQPSSNSMDLKNVVQKTMQEFADAVEKGDFNDFCSASMAKTFQNNACPSQMKELFSSFITKKNQMVPLLRSTADKSPTFSPEPKVETKVSKTKGKIMIVNVAGIYNMAPNIVRFNFQYIREGNELKPVTVVVETN